MYGHLNAALTPRIVAGTLPPANVVTARESPRPGAVLTHISRRSFYAAMIAALYLSGTPSAYAAGRAPTSVSSYEQLNGYITDVYKPEISVCASDGITIDVDMVPGAYVEPMGVPLRPGMGVRVFGRSTGILFIAHHIKVTSYEPGQGEPAQRSCV